MRSTLPFCVCVVALSAQTTSAHHDRTVEVCVEVDLVRRLGVFWAVLSQIADDASQGRIQLRPMDTLEDCLRLWVLASHFRHLSAPTSMFFPAGRC